jgi:AcrR family transcriptional regulator
MGIDVLDGFGHNNEYCNDLFIIHPMIRDINKQETYEAIIDAAERLLDRYGYSKMTMTDLAEEAGIGVGTIYLYFPGKVDVALAVADRVNTRVRSQLQEIADAAPPPAQRLKQMLVSRILIRYDRVRNQQHPTDEFKRAVQPVLSERRAHWQAEEAKIFARVLEEGHSNGEFVFDNAQLTAEILMLATTCLLPRNLTAEDLTEPRLVHQKTERLAGLLMGALRTG